MATSLLLHRSEAPPAGDLVVSADVGAEEWDRFVATCPDRTAYHEWRWRGIIERAFGHRTAYLAARRDGAIAGVLPLVLFRSPLFGRFVVSLPFVNYGGVLADDEPAGAALLAAAERLGREGGFSHLELRHLTHRFAALPCKEHKVTMRLRLAASTERAWTEMDRKVRNQIRKAEKSGLAVAAGGRESLDAFYAIFAHNMRDLGTPVYARRFFAEVLDALGDRAVVVVVSRDGAPVASGIAVVTGDTVEVPWASSLAAFRSTCPNHLLYWFVIQWAIERGLRVLDFGRSTPNEGTFHFKQQWGAEPVPLYWEYSLFRSAALPDLSPKNPKLRMMVELWKRCPLWLTIVLGPHVVRSIP